MEKLQKILIIPKVDFLEDMVRTGFSTIAAHFKSMKQQNPGLGKLLLSNNTIHAHFFDEIGGVFAHIGYISNSGAFDEIARGLQNIPMIAGVCRMNSWQTDMVILNKMRVWAQEHETLVRHHQSKREADFDRVAIIIKTTEDRNLSSIGCRFYQQALIELAQTDFLALVESHTSWWIEGVTKTWVSEKVTSAGICARTRFLSYRYMCPQIFLSF